MNDIILTLVLAVSVACMYLAQSKSTPKPSRRIYSLLGSAASVMVALEAARRDETSVAVLFTVATITSLASLALDYFKTSKPDA